MPFFKNRTEAGQRLAERLASERLVAPVVVLALPRGGVPVAAEVARRLAAPLDLLLVRKIGAPWQRELAVAAVVDGDAPEVVVDEASAPTPAPTAPIWSARPRPPWPRSSAAARSICRAASRCP